MQHSATAALTGANGICRCGPAGTPAFVAVSNWMVNIVGAPVVPGVTVGGLNVAVAPGGSPVADIVTTLLNGPPSGGTVMPITTEPPSAAVNGVAAAVTAYATVTVSVSTDEVEVPREVLPEYTAVMPSAPAGRDVMLKVATPDELTLPVPSRVVPL